MNPQIPFPILLKKLKDSSLFQSIQRLECGKGCPQSRSFESVQAPSEISQNDALWNPSPRNVGLLQAGMLQSQERQLFLEVKSARTFAHGSYAADIGSPAGDIRIPVFKPSVRQTRVRMYGPVRKFPLPFCTFISLPFYFEV